MTPIISTGKQDMHIQIGSNHFPTLRQMPDGWELDIKPDRMPKAVTVLEYTGAALLIALILWQTL